MALTDTLWAARPAVGRESRRTAAVRWVISVARRSSGILIMQMLRRVRGICREPAGASLCRRYRQDGTVESGWIAARGAKPRPPPNMNQISLPSTT